MFTSLRSQGPILFLGGVLAVSAGCSQGRDRTRDQNTAAATTSAAATVPSDSSQLSGGTPAAPVESTPPVAAASTTQRPRPKPSIDPGRKSASPTRPKSLPPTATASPTAPADTPTTSAPAKPAAAGGQTEGLKYDASSNTVTFDLIGGPHGFQFNGYASGGATLTLPPKANVVMNFINKDGTPHSAEVFSGEGPIPTTAGDVAIPRAYTNQRIQGLPQEATDVMRFTVPASGNYRIICGVPGHALSGMWIWMKIDPAAKQPSFGPTKK